MGGNIKKFVFIVTIVIILLIGCKRNNPSSPTIGINSPTPTETMHVLSFTATFTPSITITPVFTDTATTTPVLASDPQEGAIGGTDSSVYPFEALSDISNFGFSGGFSSILLSQDKAYMGSGSLKVNVVYDAPNKHGMLYIGGITLNALVGKTISFRIWVPNGMFSQPNPYGAMIYVQTSCYDWYQSSYVNLSAPTGSIGGYWNTVTANVNNDLVLQNGSGSTGHINGYTLSENGVDTGLSVTIGIYVAQGSASNNYTGHIFIDSFDIE
jgi:hypothetical protein